MTSPQVENGYTPIANEIMDALSRYRIPGEQMQCLLHILRMTYGWSRKSADLSFADISKATGIKRENVARAIKSLLSKKIIGVIKKDNGLSLNYTFNKQFNEWEVISKKITAKKGVIKNDTKVLSKLIQNAKNTSSIKTIKTNSDDFPKKKKFIPPTKDEVLNFFAEKGYSKEAAAKAFEYYENANPPWTDSRGKQVVSWKSKMIAVWFKPENKSNVIPIANQKPKFLTSKDILEMQK